MRRYYPSFLILRGKRKRRRIRVRRGSYNDAVRDQRLSDLEWAEDRREREGGRIVSVWLQMGAFGYMVSDLQQRGREVIARVDLNTAEIALIKARERPGWGATEKAMHWDLTNKNAEEIHDLEDRVRLLERAAGEQPDA